MIFIWCTVNRDLHLLVVDPLERKRLPKRIVLGNFTGEVKKEWIGEEWVDCAESAVRAFHIPGNWVSALLEAGVWH